MSILVGPDFDLPQPLITNLPVSNHDHAVNGMQFDNNGDLLICVGGNTNAGVPHKFIGDLPESPLSAAILKAEISRPDFDGELSYVETGTGLPNDDQVFGDIVDLVPGTHVSVHASGLRNSYELVYTTRGRLYATDNGPSANTLAREWSSTAVCPRTASNASSEWHGSSKVNGPYVASLNHTVRRSTWRPKSATALVDANAPVGLLG